ncbi:hypothetical protein Tco_1289603, partial [Tanacetum coccineum]
TMADMNIHVNDVAAEQAPAIKSQMNPIFPIDVAILKNTNFFRAFTTSSMILAIYIQQFWDTMCFDSSTGLYSCQLDEQWFNIHKDILREALDINPTNDDNPFVASPSSDTVIEYVNTLGYPSTLRNVSAISFEEESSSGFTRKEEDRSSAYLKSVGKDGREIFGMPIPDALLTDVIKRAPYYGEYLEHVTKYQQYLNEEHGKAREEGVTESPKDTKVTKPKAAKRTKPSAPKASKVTKPADEKAPKQTSSQPPKSTPAPTEPSKKDQGKKRKSVKETSNAPSPVKRSKVGKVTKKRMPKGPLQLVDEFVNEGVPEKEPAYVAFREPDSGRFQPLLEVQGKGKEKVIEEQAAHDLLTLQTPKRKSPTEQFIFQRCTPMPTEPSRIADLPSLDADLAPIDNEIESGEEMSGINTRDQDEGHAGPNPGVQDEGQAKPNPSVQDEGQARSNPGDAAESQPQSSHVVHAGPNLEHTDLEATDASTQQNTEQMDDEFTTTAYPNVQENLKLPTKDQDTSSVPPMATLVIDLTVSHLVSITVHAPLPTSTTTTTTITTTTSLLPPPPQPQQSSSDLILLQCIGELEQHIADLIQSNLALEEIKAVDEIVTDTVDWAMQAPLRARFSDLPAVDMKEVLQQRMFEDKSYLAHEDHKNLFEVLEKSLERDYSNQLISDLEEAHRKKRKKHASLRTPSRSPPS